MMVLEGRMSGCLHEVCTIAIVFTFGNCPRGAYKYCQELGCKYACAATLFLVQLAPCQAFIILDAVDN